MILSCFGVLVTDGQTDGRMDIGGCRVAFVTENWTSKNVVPCPCVGVNGICVAGPVVIGPVVASPVVIGPDDDVGGFSLIRTFPSQHSKNSTVKLS